MTNAVPSWTATFQVLDSHVWLVATPLDSADREHFHWKQKVLLDSAGWDQHVFNLTRTEVTWDRSLIAVEIREEGFVEEEEWNEVLNDRFDQAKAENNFSFRQELKMHK